MIVQRVRSLLVKMAGEGIAMEVIDPGGKVVISFLREREGVVVAAPDMGRDMAVTSLVRTDGVWIPVRVRNNALASYVRSERTDEAGQTAAFMLSETIQWMMKDASPSRLTHEERMRRVLTGDYDETEANALLPEGDEARLLVLFHTYDQGAATLYPILLEIFKSGAQVFTIGANEVVVVHAASISADELHALLEAVLDTARTEFSLRVDIGISSAVKKTHELRGALKEARKAIELGARRSKEEHVFSYQQLLLERFLQQMPRETARELYATFFSGDMRALMGNEMMLAVDRFFENNLNLSETARQLYIHRNTLVYRLDKIQKMTGLDLRQFCDAVLCKILMILSYDLYPSG